MHCLRTTELRASDCITDYDWDLFKRSTPFSISWKKGHPRRANEALSVYNARRTYYLQESKYYTLYISILPIVFLLFARYYSYRKSKSES